MGRWPDSRWESPVGTESIFLACSHIDMASYGWHPSPLHRLLGGWKHILSIQSTTKLINTQPQSVWGRGGVTRAYRAREYAVKEHHSPLSSHPTLRSSTAPTPSSFQQLEKHRNHYLTTPKFLSQAVMSIPNEQVSIPYPSMRAIGLC